MARFTPPLTKPGNHRCPKCGVMPLTRDFWLKAEWRCPKCQSLLEWDMARRNVAKLIGVLLGVAVSVAVVLLGHLPWHLPLVVGAGVVLILFIYWWLDSISLVEEQKPVDSTSAQDKPPGAA